MAKKKSKRKPKTRKVFVVKGNYGYGWEDLTQETNFFAGKNRVKEYRDNERNVAHRLITRRVPYFDLSETDRKANKREVKDFLERRRKIREMKKLMKS